MENSSSHSLTSSNILVSLDLEEVDFWLPEPGRKFFFKIEKNVFSYFLCKYLESQG